MGISFLLAHLIRQLGMASTQQDKILILMGVVSWSVAVYFSKAHQVFVQGIPRLIAWAKSCFIFGVCISMLGFFFKEAAYSRLIVFYFVFIFAFGALVLHCAGDYTILQLRRQKKNLKNVCLIGAGDVAEELELRIGESPEYGFRVICREPVATLGDMARLRQVICEYRVNELFMLIPVGCDVDFSSVTDLTDEFGLGVNIIPHMEGELFGGVKYAQFFSWPVLRLKNIPLDQFKNKVLKRMFDIVFSSAVLLLTSPLFIFAAVMVRLSSPGPVLFKQKRTGYNQNDFLCYKFRSMRVTAPDVADRIQASKDDPRKTWVGEWMRKTNVDELPQFINVLMGDMSVVGPRPHMLAHTDEFSQRVDKYLHRHHVKPGITGWAQVNGWRGPTDTDEKLRKRVECDLWYVENWTFRLDMRIILMTVFSRSAKQNAV
jgi:putative colanic acid biosynthesis UDP-glucose lipid carrier transferase